MTRSWTLITGWDKPPLSMNDRGGWQAHAGTKANVRKTAAILAKNAGIPQLDRCSLRMFWTVPDRKVRDEENPMATYKVFADGLVDAGVVPDDRPQYMAKHIPVIEYAKGQTGVRFVIEEAA